MLKRLTKQIDGAVVTAWDGVHAEVTSKAIAAGKPVFCEKLMTTTKTDCAEIVRNEQAAGRNLVQVGFMRRYARITARSRLFWIPVSWASR